MKPIFNFGQNQTPDELWAAMAGKLVDDVIATVSDAAAKLEFEGSARAPEAMRLGSRLVDLILAAEHDALPPAAA